MIHNVAQAAEFFARYGGVSKDSDRLLSTTPTEAELQAAIRTVHRTTEKAAQYIRDHHALFDRNEYGYAPD